MTYEATISIPADDYERINRLLAISSLGEMTNEELLAAGANTDYCEGIFCVDFPNGSSLTFDLCSGNENYFDDVVWTSKDGSLDVVLDCAYELDDIEFDAEGDTYIVQIVKEESLSNQRGFIPESLSWCRSHYVPPVKEHISCHQFGNIDGMDGGCWWCMEMTPYQWHMCSDASWVRGLMRGCPCAKPKSREEAVEFIEQYKQRHPHGNERKMLISENDK